MISRPNPRFRKLFRGLPANIQKQARQAYRLFQDNPYHAGLHFKQVHDNLPIYSARVSQQYRVLGLLEGDIIVWFWIETHGEYDKLLSQL